MRILVAMSGGVDSSVTAALLQKEGHEVIGATLQLYDNRQPQKKKGSCCAGQDIRDARLVADHLHFPHYVINAQKRFYETVIERFARSYAQGETPVPCIACNEGVKFTDLLGLARDIGADAMATGHYVRRIETSKDVQLHRPVDQKRDQSWFLFSTTYPQLEYLRFPLGGIPDKEIVRQYAHQFGLPISRKPDSQDICFVTDGSYVDVVESMNPQMTGPGEIVNEQGEHVGEHEGVMRYTVGQTKRLGNAAMYHGQRQMVVKVEPKKKRIVIGPRASSYVKDFFIHNVNWLISPKEEGISCHVQLRARETPRKAWIQPLGEKAHVKLSEAGLPAPGQACVFYDGSRVLGGGFISAYH